MADRARLALARRDLGEFAALIDRPLTAWQVGALRLERHVSVVVAPRQTGKSRSLAVLALWWAYRRRGQRVLVVSAGEEASRRLLAEVRSTAFGSPFLAGSMVDETAGLVTLSNGSEVRSVPASERQIRGWTVDLLLVDEAALVPDDLMLGAALPTTAARPDARIVLASSPLGATGAFHDYAQRGWAGSEHVASFRWRLADAGWVSSGTVAALREGLTDRRARAELEAEFVDLAGGEGLVERQWVLDAQHRTLAASAAGTAVVGLDVARHGGDLTVAYVNRGGRVRRLFAGQGMDLMVTTGRLAAALRDGLQAPPERAVAVVDDAGVGGGVTDRAREQGLPVFAFIGAARADRPQRFANLRAECFWALRVALQDGLLDLDPADADLAEQLVALRVEYDSAGRVKIESKADMRRRGIASPDAADSLSMTFSQPAWRAPVELSEADKAAAIVARHDAAVAARAWNEAGYERWVADRARDLEPLWRAHGLSF